MSDLKIKENNIVKSNKLLMASFELTAIEYKIILAAISLVNPILNGISSVDFYRFNIKQLQDVGVTSNLTTKEIKAILDSLYSRNVLIHDENFKNPINTRWIQSYVLEDNRNIGIKFGDDVSKYLMNLTGNYTKYYLNQISSLKLFHSVRIFEMLIQYRTIGHRTFLIEDLKSVLCLTGKYTKYNDFKRKVIDVAVDEINKSGALKINKVIPIKNGRSVVGIKFVFRETVTIRGSSITYGKQITGDGFLTFEEFFKKIERCETVDDGYERLKKDGYIMPDIKDLKAFESNYT